MSVAFALPIDVTLGDAVRAADRPTRAPTRRWSLYTLQPARGYVGALVIEGTGA